MTGINYRELLSGHNPEKSLLMGRKRMVGRNSDGRITTRHKGGGAKRVFRIVDFRYDKKDIPGLPIFIDSPAVQRGRFVLRKLNLNILVFF